MKKPNVSHKNHRRYQPRRCNRPQLDALESRTLFNGSLWAPLYINSTDAADTIVLTQSSDLLTVTLNGVATIHDTRWTSLGANADGTKTAVENGISKVIVQAKAGNDIVRADGSVTLRLEIHGGYGDDNLRGGAIDDGLYGEAGNDKLMGGGGADLISGGDNDDLVSGGEQDDRLYGDGGNDVIISVGGGFDQAFGGAGTDSFWLDPLPTDNINDLASAEQAADGVHRVGSFAAFNYRTPAGAVTTYAPSKSLLGQNIPDPVKLDGTFESYVNFSDRPLFGAGGPVADDIVQASGGRDPADCWFMASLSGIARKQPNFLRQRMADLGDGTYAVRIWRNGVENFVRLDADLPVKEESPLVGPFGPGKGTPGLPLYAGLGADEALWVALLEKAMASFRDLRTMAVDYQATPDDPSDDQPPDPIYAAYARVSYGSDYEAWRFLGTAEPQYRSPTTLVNPKARAQWALDRLADPKSLGGNISYKGHVRAIVGGTYDRAGNLTGLRFRDPYGFYDTITLADMSANKAWVSAVTSTL